MSSDEQPLDDPPSDVPSWRPTIDNFTDYEELRLPDGRVLRRYDSGAVRVENPKSGIIQEERVDGGLIISLPNGQFIFQEYRGEPLIVFDAENGGEQTLARVGSATLPGEIQARIVIFFKDSDGVHLVDIETLRYYKVRHDPTETKRTVSGPKPGSR